MSLEPYAADLERFREDSRARLARLRPADTLKGLFINRYLALFDELGGAPLRAKGAAVLQGQRVLDFFNYPYALVVDMALAVADELIPRFGGAAPMLFEVGRLATRSYLDSVVGRLFLGSFQPAPASLLKHMPWAISTTFSFGRRSVEFPAPGRAELVCRDDFSAAESNAGAVHAALERVGARDVRVEPTWQDLFNYRLVISWTEASGS